MRCGTTTFRLVALLAAGLVGGEVLAQMSGGYPMQAGYPAPAGGARSAGPMQALFTSPIGGSQYVDAHGNPVVMPAQYCDSCGPYGGGCEYPGYGAPAYGSCGPGCGCAGCGGGFNNGYGAYAGQCGPGTEPPFEDGLENFSLLPPGRTEQCGPHYFDVRMEAIVMTREEAFRTPVDFSSLNVAGPIVLSSTQLDFEYEGGFRILGRYDVGPLSVIEFGYWGLENLNSQAQFVNPDADTFSLFTDFVRDPDVVPSTVTDPGGALPWTERSTLHRISLESELHNGEFNYRRYWVGFNPTVSGTLLAGFRYTRLREDFQFYTQGGEELTFAPASATYDENIKNDLAGFQTGGDIWFHVRQGLRIGAEGKVGLMNNHYTLTNTFTAFGQNDDSGPPPNFSERFEKDQPALAVDGSVDVVWDVSPSWSIRAGYEVLFLNSVLLAGENFNTGTVYNDEQGVLLPERVPFVNNQGDAFYHGGHLGLEYVW